jgi:hypothetical protein
MALIFNNNQGATTMSAPTRIVTIYDPVSGCPAAARTNPLISATINIARPSFFWFMGSMIRNANGRTDAQLVIQGPAGSNYATAFSTPRLNWTSAGTWDHMACDAGYFGNIAGNWTFSLNASSPGVWGCNRQWGHISIVVFEV